MKGILLLSSLFLVSCSSTSQVIKTRMDNLRTKMNAPRKPQSVELKGEKRNARAFGNFGTINR